MGIINNTLSIYILDNTAFASGFNPNIFSPETPIYITNGIYDETKINPISSQNIEIALLQHILSIRDPDDTYMDKCIEFATKSGDVGALSEADKSIIALALELSEESSNSVIKIFTDDYSIQNVIAMINMDQITIVNYSEKGIVEPIVWEVYCPVCFTLYIPTKLGKICESCGVPIKRRRKKQKKNKK